MGGVIRSMIYLIHFVKNFCKCHEIPPLR
jgi:hypothetical protein